MNCPKCGEECERDAVDIGVGIDYGPWGCYGCGWSEDAYYDLSEGKSQAEKDHPGWYVDQTGGMQRIDAIVERCQRFGIDPDAVRKAFDNDAK